MVYRTIHTVNNLSSLRSLRIISKFVSTPRKFKNCNKWTTPNLKNTKWLASLIAIFSILHSLTRRGSRYLFIKSVSCVGLLKAKTGRTFPFQVMLLFKNLILLCLCKICRFILLFSFFEFPYWFPVTATLIEKGEYLIEFALFIDVSLEEFQFHLSCALCS